jgi:hypothetical protein
MGIGGRYVGSYISVSAKIPAGTIYLYHPDPDRSNPTAKRPHVELGVKDHINVAMSVVPEKAPTDTMFDVTGKSECAVHPA